jgi:hypothetical protein
VQRIDRADALGRFWHTPDDFGDAAIPSALRGTSDLSTCGLSEAMGVEWPVYLCCTKARLAKNPKKARGEQKVCPYATESQLVLTGLVD